MERMEQRCLLSIVCTDDGFGNITVIGDSADNTITASTTSGTLNVTGCTPTHRAM